MSDKLKIKIHHWQNLAIMRELIDEFLPPSAYELEEEGSPAVPETIQINASGSGDRDEIKREIYDVLRDITGKSPEWGILTGVRPVKLAGELLEEKGSRDKVRDIFLREYYLSEEKTELLLEIYDRQKSLYGKPDPDSVSIYIGIPFCPTRCSYCSFASNQVEDDQVEEYLEALFKEIDFVSGGLRDRAQTIETLYIGGGTPTRLDTDQMDRLMDRITKHFDLSHVKEFTCEAGRPDTIYPEKLKIMKGAGVDRVSVNPQSMKHRTLDLIGRSHSPEDTVRAFHHVMEAGFRSVNSDIIAGLPEEELPDFLDTLSRVIEMGADNVTVHTLAVKRSSRLHEEDSLYHYQVEDRVRAMLKGSRDLLEQKDFSPYYLYRQKHMAGALENTGYTLGEKDGLYNIRIMDEHQTIIALGAGGITKRYYPETNRLVRIPNVTNYRHYIDRIDEMIDRKRKDLWR